MLLGILTHNALTPPVPASLARRRVQAQHRPRIRRVEPAPVRVKVVAVVVHTALSTRWEACRGGFWRDSYGGRPWDGDRGGHGCLLKRDVYVRELPNVQKKKKISPGSPQNQKLRVPTVPRKKDGREGVVVSQAVSGWNMHENDLSFRCQPLREMDGQEDSIFPRGISSQ